MLDLEIGARTNRGPELMKIKDYGLTTCNTKVKNEDRRNCEDVDVVILSCNTTD